jgi:hypothetical protein
VVDALVDYIRRPDRFDPSGAASHRAFPKCSVARGVAACCSGNPVPAAGPRCEGRGGLASPKPGRSRAGRRRAA